MNKPRGRPFPPGNTQGRGRPPGSRNKTKSPEQQVLDDYALHLMRKCITLAMQGDKSALRICMDRISPARQDACIRMSLPPITTTQDVDKAAEKVTQTIRRGSITPIEGGRMMNILEGRSRIIQRVQLESRLRGALDTSGPQGGPIEMGIVERLNAARNKLAAHKRAQDLRNASEQKLP